MAFSQAGLGLNHAIAHQLGGQFHLPHGLANALLLTAVIRFNAGEPRAAKRYARLARACRFCPPAAGEQEAFQALLTAVETLKQQCAIPTLQGALQESIPFSYREFPPWCRPRWPTPPCAPTRVRSMARPSRNCWRTCNE
ncbi:propanediol utilization protein PduQ [Klebsiella pneumoniae]|uniref:Propanediol utilization protein PduQ n=1 Tax=Klebsiella pneumoniae TaxID=573 RepID=A0A378FPN8_KLEPN|nr:propanediol utilization protein PduQ [Klebsiella pneumoniae]